MKQAPPSTSPHYRPDIDGLRAIAVLAVLLYHLDVPFLTGGFVGVDIFFVISGYLITSIVAADIRAARFSYRGFYERRIRRIYPALFVVMGFSTLAGVLLLEPVTLKDLGQSLIAATLFSANLLFWHESDYFAPSALEKPLLHTWSLSVEEQFYFLFPPLLLLLFRCSLRWRGILFATSALLSLLLCLRMTASVPTAAFYLLPARAWELMAGAALALGFIPPASAGWQRSAASFAGAGLIAGSLFLLSKKTPFPGPGALIPVLGAAAIIWSGAGSSPRHPVYRLLSVRPLVLVGLVSYSLYLWHWPLIVFADLLLARPLAGPEIAGLAVGTLVIAGISWKFIEQPFRKRAAAPPGRPPIKSRQQGTRGVWFAAGALMAAAIAAGGIIHLGDGLKQRFSGQTAFPSYGTDPLWRGFTSAEDRLRQLSQGGRPSVIGASNAEPSFILWGDSHANSLASGLGEAAAAAGQTGYLASHGLGLKPLLGIAGFAAREDDFDEPAYNEQIMRFIEAQPGIRLVILAGYWSFPGPLRDASREFPAVSSPLELTRIGLSRTVERLRRAGKGVIVCTDVPALERSPRGRLWTAQLLGRDLDRVAASLGTSRLDYERRNGPYLSIFRELAARFGCSVLEIDREFFTSASPRSRILHKNQLLYVDNDHLSTSGSGLLAPAFVAALASLPETTGTNYAPKTQHPPRSDVH